MAKACQFPKKHHFILCQKWHCFNPEELWPKDISRSEGFFVDRHTYI